MEDARSLFGPAVWIAIAVILALFAGAIWYALVRPVTPRVAYGTIVGKTYQPAGEYERIRSGPRREFWSSDRIRLPEGYLFDIRLENDAHLRYSLELHAAARFEPGMRVQIQYDERSLPFLWTRAYIRDMKAAQ
jgi:hypothetical protein